MNAATRSRYLPRKRSVSIASAVVSVGKPVKHIASGAMPAPARWSMTSATTPMGAPLSIMLSTRGLADSTPSAQATAPPRRRISARSAVRYFSGFRSVAQRRASADASSAAASLTSVFGATESCEK